MVTRTADPTGAPEAVRAEVPVPPQIGRFQIVSELGKGGMGVVYAARMQGAHGVSRLVALKTLNRLPSASERAALLAEARLTAKLHHRNVVATLELGEVDVRPYIVMELVDGVSLAELLAHFRGSGLALPPDLAAWIVMQVALGLHAAHELRGEDGAPLGLVHRDVTPQNVLLSTSGEVKLADFGIAKYAGRGEPTATGLIKGKFAYMSPEQGQGLPLDRRSDVFALGVVLWEALTGARLFAADTPAQTLLRVNTVRPAPPDTHRLEVGTALSALTLRCLARDPAERFATAADLADAIRSNLRERHSHVDESDLGALLARHFGAERKQAMAQLAARAEATTASELDDTTVLEEIRPPRRTRRMVLAALLVISTAAAALAVRECRTPRQVSSPAPSSWSTR